MKYKVEMIISKEEIDDCIIKLGKSISNFYKRSDESILLVGLLRGSFIFMADLCRAVTISHEIDFMTVSSYGKEMNSSKYIKILKDLDEDIYGKNVLIIEDIIDSGRTLKYVCEILTSRKPKSLFICTLLDKPYRREVKIPVYWVGFTILNEFVVGYGIDYAQNYRHLPYIGKVITESKFKIT